MSENIQTKDKTDPKRSDVVIGVIETTMIILGAYSARTIIGHLMKNFSFSFECLYNKEYEEEEGMLPPPYKP